MARGFYAESACIWRYLGEPRRLGVALTGLGRTAFLHGDLAEASALVDEALGIHRTLGHHVDAGTALICLGDIAIGQGAPDEANARYAEALAIARDVGDRTLALQALEGLAEVAVPIDPRRAVGLVGAAAEGRRMAAERVIAEALAALDESAIRAARHSAAESSRAGRVPEATSHSGRDHLLTGREWEVAALITRGLTNRQIATELAISELTVATHVRNILGKLDFEHRTQVAV